MVVQRANVELRPSAKKARTSSPSPSDALALGVTSLREHANSLAPSESDSFLAELDEFERTLKQADDLQLEKIRVLRILASAGTMWLVLIHQLRATLDAVKRMIKDIRRRRRGRRIGVRPAGNMGSPTRGSSIRAWTITWTIREGGCPLLGRCSGC